MSYLVLRADYPDEFNPDRFYTKAMGEQIRQQYHQRLNSAGVVYGECRSSTEGTLETSLSRVSHTVEDLFWQGPELHATIRVLRTQSGNELKTLLDEGWVHFSVRGLGSIKANGEVVIDRLFAIDALPGARDPFFVQKLRRAKLERILHGSSA